MKEIILSTNGWQIGVSPDHSLIATVRDIGLLAIHLNNDQRLIVANYNSPQSLLKKHLRRASAGSAK